MARSRKRLLVLAALGLSSADVVVGCTSNSATPAGGFGDAKPVRNDGSTKLPADQPGGSELFANVLTVVPSYDRDSHRLTVLLKLKDGYHAYAPGEQVGKPVEIAIAGDNGWALDGAPLMPPGVQRDLGALGKSLILEGEIPIQVQVKGGSGELKGEVKAQVCTDKACDRPRTHAFSVPTT